MSAIKAGANCLDIFSYFSSHSNSLWETIDID